MDFIKNILFSGKNRRTQLIIIDTLALVFVAAVYFLFDGRTALGRVANIWVCVGNAAVLLLLNVLFRSLLGIYKNVWRYTSTRAYFMLSFSDGVSCLAAIIVNAIVGAFVEKYFIGFWSHVTISALTLLVCLVLRFSYRLVYKYFNRQDAKRSMDVPKIPIAIIGAGQLGAYLASELSTSPKSHYVPKCFIDTDRAKIKKTIGDIPVVSAEDSGKAMEQYGFAEVVIAIAGMDSEKYKNLWELYSELGCKIKVYDSPVPDTFVDSPTKKARVIRDFSIEDLLFRKPLTINNQSEFDYYRGKTVLVTGGGGSIGSELCRQLAKCGLKKLIIFDIYENNAYDIQQELLRKHGDKLDLVVEIGSVRDCDRLNCVFKNYNPDIVFHAAAHKHVPLMEHSGCEAIKNNVLGTYNTANMAEKYGAEKFILISTDKAVNPTNIMGASKRLCEMVVQCRQDSSTSFAAVRFGNVLGSNGSVIPLFKRQIMSGGPVTITDKRIIRYFMTIPEASQLVIQAGAKAKKGELFVLDMGKPVRIYDLAVNMIKMMGFTVGRDIEIKEIGLRPGEKLYEELLMKTETLEKTDSDMIFIERDTPYSREEMEQKIALLREAVESSKDEIRSAKIRAVISKTVPTFVDPDVVNKDAEKSEEMQNVKEPAIV